MATICTLPCAWIKLLFRLERRARKSISQLNTNVSEINIVQVPYLPSSRTQTQNVMKLLHGRAGCLADLGSGDGRLVSL